MKKAQFDELLESVREMKAIEKGVKKPSRTFEFPPPNARQIRRKFQLSQPDFARLIGISVSTLRNWEQGLRVPEGPHKFSCAWWKLIRKRSSRSALRRRHARLRLGRAFLRLTGAAAPLSTSTRPGASRE